MKVCGVLGLEPDDELVFEFVCYLLRQKGEEVILQPKADSLMTLMVTVLGWGNCRDLD